MDMDVTIPNYMQELLKASGQGLDALTRTLANLLNQPVLVSSSAYKLVSASSHYDFDLFQMELDGPKGNHDTVFFCHISAGTFQAKAAGRAIAPAGRVLGYILILLNQELFDPAPYQLILDYTASLYAVHFHNRLELEQKQSEFQNSFLYDLLYGNLKRNDEIIATGDMLGWDFRRTHAVLIFLLPELDLYSPEWHLMDMLSRNVKQSFIEKYYQNPATLVRQNVLVVLVPVSKNNPVDQKAEILALTDSILPQTKAGELQNRVTCGMGQPYAEATNLFRSYQEAKVALEMGRLLDIRVPFFSDLGLERILYKHDLQDLKEYYAHVLGELHKQDNTESSLIQTLESFADHQFDVSKTAEAVFLHRNTLRYRLNKIENILGKSLTDTNTRLDIVAALKIRRLHNIDQKLE